MDSQLEDFRRDCRKSPQQTLGGDPKKNNFTECATINDLTMVEGRETPKNQALTILKGFSTVSADTCSFGPLALKPNRRAQSSLTVSLSNTQDQKKCQFYLQISMGVWEVLIEPIPRSSMKSMRYLGPSPN